MTKNEIVARWMGFAPLNKMPQAGITENQPIPILIKNLKYDSDYNKLHQAWVKFRDLKFNPEINHYYEHIDICNTIRYWITDKPITEAFDELMKGIEWYQSLKQ